MKINRGFILLELFIEYVDRTDVINRITPLFFFSYYDVAHIGVYCQFKDLNLALK